MRYVASGKRERESFEIIRFMAYITLRNKAKSGMEEEGQVVTWPFPSIRPRCAVSAILRRYKFHLRRPNDRTKFISSRDTFLRYCVSLPVTLVTATRDSVCSLRSPLERTSRGQSPSKSTCTARYCEFATWLFVISTKELSHFDFY